LGPHPGEIVLYQLDTSDPLPKVLFYLVFHTPCEEGRVVADCLADKDAENQVHMIANLCGSFLPLKGTCKTMGLRLSKEEVS
jgi:hypothetical protein